VILVDSSAWVEFLRQTGSSTNRKLASLLAGGQQLAWTDMVALEVLAGARDDADRDRLRRLVYSHTPLPVSGPTDYESAAELFRTCRRSGETPRGLVDCLIAAVAIRSGVKVLSDDSDFEVLARHTDLRLASD
jgi:predicted nucleic acid-binding protein